MRSATGVLRFWGVAQQWFIGCYAAVALLRNSATDPPLPSPPPFLPPFKSLFFSSSFLRRGGEARAREAAPSYRQRKGA